MVMPAGYVSGRGAVGIAWEGIPVKPAVPVMPLHIQVNIMSHKNRNKHLNSRVARDRFASIRLFLDDCFARHSRLLVLRLDFSYRDDVHASLDTVSRDRDKLVRYLRKPYNHRHKNAYIGLLWKLEYGQSKGYHLHTLIVLNGSRLQQDVTYARIIGEHWKQHLTQGDGLYHNCNADKGKYEHCGIGMVEHRDPQKRHYLLHDAAAYLAKDDELIQEVLLRESERLADMGEGELARQVANTRCFGKSILSVNEQDTPRRGRPRSRDDIRW